MGNLLYFIHFSGYVTYNYQWDGFQPAKIELLMIHINDLPIYEFSEIMPSNQVKTRAKEIVKKLREVGFHIISKDFLSPLFLHFSRGRQEKNCLGNSILQEIPRQQYEVRIKATLGQTKKALVQTVIAPLKKDFRGQLKGNFGGLIALGFSSLVFLLFF